MVPFHDLVAIFVGQIGVGSPILGRIQTIVQTQILTPLVSAISAVVNTEVLSPIVSALSTIVSIVVGTPKWWVDCAYVQTVDMTPTGLQEVASRWHTLLYLQQ